MSPEEHRERAEKCEHWAKLTEENDRLLAERWREIAAQWHQLAADAEANRFWLISLPLA
jgi:hypothetical protein